MDEALEYLNSVPEKSRDRQWQLAKVEYDTIVGQFVEAETKLNELIEENKKDQRAAMALADLLQTQREFIKADMRYDELGASDNDSVAILHLARSLTLQHRYCEAEQMVLRELKEIDDDPNLYILLGNIQWKTGRLCEANASFKKPQSIWKKSHPR